MSDKSTSTLNRGLCFAQLGPRAHARRAIVEQYEESEPSLAPLRRSDRLQRAPHAAAQASEQLECTRAWSSRPSCRKAPASINVEVDCPTWKAPFGRERGSRRDLGVERARSESPNRIARSVRIYAARQSSIADFVWRRCLTALGAAERENARSRPSIRRTLIAPRASVSAPLGIDLLFHPKKSAYGADLQPDRAGRLSGE